MTIDRNTLLFFDSSCLIAAAGSPSGGSSFLLSLCSRELLSGAVSQPVLLEAHRNIQLKLGENALSRLYRLLTVVPFVLAPIPPKDQFEELIKSVNEKDLHVVGAAIAINAQFLLTLDKGLAVEVNRAGVGIQALSPGDFIKTVLKTHVDYPKEKN